MARVSALTGSRNRAERITSPACQPAEWVKAGSPAAASPMA